MTEIYKLGTVILLAVVYSYYTSCIKTGIDNYHKVKSLYRLINKGSCKMNFSKNIIGGLILSVRNISFTFSLLKVLAYEYYCYFVNLCTFSEFIYNAEKTYIFFHNN